MAGDDALLMRKKSSFGVPVPNVNCGSPETSFVPPKPEGAALGQLLLDRLHPVVLPVATVPAACLMMLFLKALPEAPACKICTPLNDALTFCVRVLTNVL